MSGRTLLRLPVRETHPANRLYRRAVTARLRLEKSGVLLDAARCPDARGAGCCHGAGACQGATHVRERGQLAARIYLKVGCRPNQEAAPYSLAVDCLLFGLSAASNNSNSVCCPENSPTRV